MGQSDIEGKKKLLEELEGYLEELRALKREQDRVFDDFTNKVEEIKKEELRRKIQGEE